MSRVVETLLVDRMALLLEDEVTPHFGSMWASGFGSGHPPALPKRSAVGSRLVEGHNVTLDDPTAVGRFAVEEIEFWRDTGLYYFVPCVARTGPSPCSPLPQHSGDRSQRAWPCRGRRRTDCHGARNARLDRQLHVRPWNRSMRAFNENPGSLDAGLLVGTSIPPRSDGTPRCCALC